MLDNSIYSNQLTSRQTIKLINEVFFLYFLFLKSQFELKLFTKIFLLILTNINIFYINILLVRRDKILVIKFLNVITKVMYTYIFVKNITIKKITACC